MLRPAMRPPLVLVANDQEFAVRSLESVLTPRGYGVARAFTGQRALELIRAAQPDAIILDMQLPDVEGLEVCRRLRTPPEISRLVPIILTTSGEVTRAQRVEAYAAGAWDVLTEPLDLEVFLAKLDAFIRAKREVDGVRQAGLLDGGTGLYNSSGLTQRVREISAGAARHHQGVACVAFSVTQIGMEPSVPLDVVAEHVRAACDEQLRGSDVVGRLGPDEFAVVAPATDREGAERLVQRLRSSAEKRPVRFAGHDHFLRLHVATAVVGDAARPEIDPSELIAAASTGLRTHQPAPNGAP